MANILREERGKMGVTESLNSIFVYKFNHIVINRLVPIVNYKGLD